MPQYNAPTLVSQMLAADTLLFWKESSGAVRTILFSDLVTSVDSLLSKVDSVSIISSNTTLDDTYQFVICNSGGAFTITLPDAASNAGLGFRIGNKGAGTVTVESAGGDVISAGGAAAGTVDILTYNTYDFQSDGVDTWFRTS